MLILTRRIGETIRIGDNIELVICDTKNSITKIGVSAPKNVPVYREEIYHRMKLQKRHNDK